MHPPPPLQPAILVALLFFTTPTQAALPRSVQHAIKAAGIPESAVSLWVQPVDAKAPAWAHRAKESRNPASVMKLLTSFAALDLLGPAYTWTTEALVTEPPRDGVVSGNVILRGGGDPFLTWDRFAGLLRELRERGVREIRGDVILDHSRFAPLPGDAASLDGRAARAYNATPDALLVNFNAVTLRLAPDADGSIGAHATLPLAGLHIDNQLKPVATPCADWKGMVAPEITASGPSIQVSLPGRFPVACGEKMLNLAAPDTTLQTANLFRALWSELGGTVKGNIRNGRAPASTQTLVSWASPPLADVLRETDKYSNNVMARQIFITLSADASKPASPAGAIARVQQWMPGQGLDPAQWVLENGSGLSRLERTTAAQLGALLLAAWHSPRMPEFVAAQPVIGVDGTMRKRLPGTPIAGRGYVKTGTLDGVKTAAGYLLNAKGRWVAFAWLINHPRADAGEPALESLLTSIYNAN